MDLIDNVVNFLKKPKEETAEKTPEGLCPVCWGYEEYDHKIRKLYEDKQVDVNNHRASYMRIQEFLVNKIDGIKLKEGEIASCPTCGNENETK